MQRWKVIKISIKSYRCHRERWGRWSWGWGASWRGFPCSPHTSPHPVHMNNWCWNVLTSPTLILIAQWTVRMTAEMPNASITARQMKNSRLKGSQMRGEWGFQEWTTCCGWRAPWWSCGGCGAWRSSSSPLPPPLSPLWLAGGREPASGFLKLYSQDFTFSNFHFPLFTENPFITTKATDLTGCRV